MFAIKTKIGYCGEDMLFEGLLAFQDSIWELREWEVKTVRAMLALEGIPYEIIKL